MRLRLVTPAGIAVDATDVRYVRGEDATGAFGIQPGHAEFVTALTVSVLSFRDGHGVESHAAVRGGVLRVIDGELVEVATREAVLGHRLDELKNAVLERMRSSAQAEATARMRAVQLNASVVRYLHRYTRAQATGGSLGLGEGFVGEVPHE